MAMADLAPMVAGPDEELFSAVLLESRDTGGWGMGHY